MNVLCEKWDPYLMKCYGYMDAHAFIYRICGNFRGM